MSAAVVPRQAARSLETMNEHSSREQQRRLSLCRSTSAAPTAAGPIRAVSPHCIYAPVIGAGAPGSVKARSESRLGQLEGVD